MCYPDGNPNNNPICGRFATVTYAGKSITVKVVDRCYACGYDDIDLSPAAFQQFAALGKSMPVVEVLALLMVYFHAGVGKLQGVSWKFN